MPATLGKPIRLGLAKDVDRFGRGPTLASGMAERKRFAAAHPTQWRRETDLLEQHAAS